MPIQKNQQGNTQLIILIILVLLIALGYYLYIKMNSSIDSMIENTNNEQTIKEENTVNNNFLVETAPVVVSGKYSLYSADTYEAAQTQKRVLFFHAAWCPTCKVANAEFEANLDKIPSNVVLLKTDYDSQASLKTKYGITYQHTFVLVDADGNALKKWAGGGINELITNTK